MRLIIHHGIAAKTWSEKVHAEQAIQRKHGKRSRQDRKGKNDEDQRANAAQTKMGIFIRVMPGQRILKIVTKKLMPEIKLPTPAICTVHIQ